MTLKLHYNVAKGPRCTVVQKKCLGLEWCDHVRTPIFSNVHFLTMWLVFTDPVTYTCVKLQSLNTCMCSWYLYHHTKLSISLLSIVSIPFCNLVFVVYFIMGKLGHWVCRESWAHKGLFNLPPQFWRLGTQGPAFLFCTLCLLCFMCTWGSFSSFFS